MKRKLIETIPDSVGDSSDSKRPRDSGVWAQFARKHGSVLSRSAKLRAFCQEGISDAGLIIELKKVLRQQTTKQCRKRREKHKSLSTKVVELSKKGNSVSGKTLDSDSIRMFYENLLGDSARPEKVAPSHNSSEEFALFDETEIRQTLKHKPKGSACGVDRVSKSMLFAIGKFPSRFRYVHALLDSFLIWGVPPCLKVALVTLVPKKPGAAQPSEFRPISVTSLLYRLYSRLLSMRFYKAISNQLSDAQGGYRIGINGCAKNLAVLRSLIGEAKVKCKPFAVASVDLSKAFDSVSHTAVRRTLEELKMPNYLRRACLDTLDDNILRFKGHKVQVQGKRGVPQGLPLSGYLFIATIDQTLKKLDTLLPYRSDSGGTFGALSLVDDLLIFSESQDDLEVKLRVLKRELRQCGWKLNSTKSYAYAHKIAGRSTLKVAEGAIPIGEGESIRLIPASEKFRYLGIQISGANALRDNSDPIFADLKKLLTCITQGNLSVVEKVKAIKQIVIPRQLYRLVNISTKSIYYKKYRKRTSTGERVRSNLTRLYYNMDVEIARALKTVLRIPKSGVDTSYFYVSESHGGLGLHRLEVLVPSMRIKVRDEMQVSDATMKLLDEYHFNDIPECARLLAKHGLDVENLDQGHRNKAMQQCAKRTATGRSLLYPSDREIVTPLIRRANSTLGFSSYRLQRAVRFRLNCLPTNTQLNKMNKSISKSCRNGCGTDESLQHLLNTRECGSLHNLWVDRHNAICKFIFGSIAKFKKPGVRIVSELKLGMAQPDLVVSDKERAYILEVGVSWSKERSLKVRFDEKKNKYATTEVSNALNVELNRLEGVDVRRRVTVIPLIFGVQGSYFDPGIELTDLVVRMMAIKSLRNTLLVSAQLGFELTLKYLGKVLKDRKQYSNTRVA